MTPLPPCGFPQHRARGRDWRCAGTDKAGQHWPTTCGICHPPAIAPERIEWLPAPEPPTAAQQRHAFLADLREA